MRTWYSIQAAAAAPTTAEISIYDEIGMWGVTAKQFISDLKSLGDVKDINLSINSPGGSVFDGLAIYNALKSHGANVTVKVMGIAASIASVIAMAGKKIIMPENSFMMIHNPWSFAMGNANDMREMADVLDKLGNSLVGTYVARTGKSEEEIRALLDAESYLTAQEALGLGFADEVTPNVAAKATFELDRLPENVKAMFLAQQEPEPAPEPQPEPEPVPDPEPEPTPEPEPEASPLAEQIEAAAKAAGFEAFAAIWALDDGVVTEADIKARISHAKDVKALCAIAKMPDALGEFIAANAPVADVKAELRKRLAAKSDANHIDTSAPTPKPAPHAQAKEHKTTQQIYAERAKAAAQAL